MSQEKLTHLRYIVYRNEQKERKVDFWIAKGEPIHDTYAKAHHIAIQDFCAGGYMGVKDGEWLIYEHYPVADDGKHLDEFDKKLVMTAFQNFPKRNDDNLKAEMAETYRQEKHLLLFAIKQMFVKEK